MLSLDFMLSDAGQKALASVGVPVDQYDADCQHWSDLFKAVSAKRAP